MDTDRPTILIADHDSAGLRHLEQFLRRLGYDVATFVSHDTLLNYAFPSAPCCALIDLQMPGLTGLQVSRRLFSLCPGLPIIFTSRRADVPTAVYAMKSGAVDFLPRPIQEQQLVKMLKSIFRQWNRRRSHKRQSASHRESFCALTLRQRQVCQLIAQGRQDEQIASELGIDDQIVQLHRNRAIIRMRLKNTADLARVIAALQIIPRIPSEPRTGGNRQLRQPPRRWM